MARWITEKVLGAMPGDGSETTTAALAQVTGLTRREVSRCFREVLNARGLANEARFGVYRLSPAGIAAREVGERITTAPLTRKNGGPIHDDTFRSRVWKALRSLGKATVPELCQMAARGDEKLPERQVRNYLGYLVKAGYVSVLARRERGTAPTSAGFKRFLLLPHRDPGPKAPVVRRRLGQVYDPNSRKAYSLETGEEVAP